MPKSTRSPATPPVEHTGQVPDSGNIRIPRRELIVHLRRAYHLHRKMSKGRFSVDLGHPLGLRQEIGMRNYQKVWSLHPM